MNMNNDATMRVIQEALLEFGVPETVLTADSRLREDLELDSTETVDLSLELHKRLGVQVKIDTVEDITLRDLCQLVASAADA
jgi:acyl carrier protein